MECAADGAGGALRERRALVTGSTQGTGAAIARLFRQVRAEVWTTGRSLPGDHPDPARFIAADLATVGGATTVAERVSEVGGVEILVHVVGGSEAPAGGFRALGDHRFRACHRRWHRQNNLGHVVMQTRVGKEGPQMNDSHVSSRESIELPDLIHRYQDAHDRHDIETALSTFTSDAKVVDEGHTFRGIDQVRSWLTTAAGAYTFTRNLVGVSAVDVNTWIVVNRLEGDFPGGVVDLRYRFELRDDLIAELIIAP